MPVPSFQKYMNPMLELLAQHDQLRITDISQQMIGYFQLTAEDLSIMVPSGTKSRHYDRVGWAATYLKQAGFLHSPQRAYYSITEAGLQAHKTGDIINVEYLRRIPQFGRFYSQPRTNADNTQQTPVEIINNTNTPDETITLAYRTLRDTLAAELLERLMNLSPRFFEQAVLDVLIAMGYGGSRSDAARRVGQSGDGGIDGIINEDRLGLDVIYLQAKRWENTIGAPQLRDFAGSLEERKAIKGIFITTSDFTREARDYVNRIGKRIILINGTELAQFMIDFGVGVLERETYVLKRIDEEYFEE